MTQPLVSIIIPAYNAERFLAEAIQSALSQTWLRTELIIVDDGSTDGTLRVAQSFASARVQVLAGEHRGYAATENRGLALAQGDLIKFVDADDLCSPNLVARQVAELQGEPDAVAVAEVRRFTDSPTAAAAPDDIIRADLPGIAWLVQAFGAAGAAMPGSQPWLIPRAVLDRAGPWDERLSGEADHELLTRVLLHTSMVRFTTGETYYYRIGHPGKLSMQVIRATVESCALARTLITDHLLGAADSPAMRRLCANLLQEFVHWYYPEYADVTEMLGTRARALGGADLPPPGPPGFQVLRRVIGWRAARQVERWAVRHGLNRAGLARRLPSLVVPRR